MKGAAALEALAAELRDDDPDRFYTALFAPPARRARLFALYAFNLEVARTRERISEPMLGQIRLQWWREALDELYRGEARRHPVVDVLQPWIREAPPDRSLFENMLDAREMDLDDAPFATIDDLTSYARRTSSDLLLLGLEALGAREARAEAVARDAGIAYALAGLLRALPFHGASGRVMLPADVLEQAGVADVRAAAARRDPDRLRQAVRHVATLASEAARRARSGPRAAPPARPVLMHLGLAELYLGRLHAAGYDVSQPRLDPGNGIRIARLVWRNLRRSY